MTIAKVIVDVPASVVNQTFDYAIPEQFHDVIQPGMRVIIPFGPRKITGFVIDITNQSEFKHLRNIIDVLDVQPVLTEELLQVGQWLAKETASLFITTFQAMLPQVLKSTYDKEIVRETEEQLTPELEKLFKEHDRVSYDEAVDMLSSLNELQQAITAGNISINYLVKSNITKKYVQLIRPTERHVLLNEKENLRKNARIQHKIIDYFIEHPDEVNQNILCQRLAIKPYNLRPLIEKGVLTVNKKEVYRNPYDQEFPKTNNLTLTEEQNRAIDPIFQSIYEERHDTYLLYGVTGSGKTEIYLQSIERVITKGKEAIVLVPEISLTPQMVHRFKGRFGSQVAVMHSALSVGERYDEWLKIQRKEVQVVVGARSAIFAPFENLGIIIIDEEHETTYKQEETPRYHARDVAIKRGEINDCPVILGSATPTLESYARGLRHVYHLLTLTERTNKQPMPHVDVVDMREELHAGNRTMFSRLLMEKIKDRIAKNEQIVLLLNRRGYSTFALCRDCGHVEQCPNCDISLTYHKRYNQLKCHYCAFERPMLTECTACQSESIRFFGTGTERVEEELTKLMPELRIIRMDVDTTRRKGAHERLLHKFSNREADVLLGTQMIAKGLDFEHVTLVGVLAADSMLHLPDFRSSEKTFQLITQVSGRAGRHELEGEVIVQTYTPEHYSIELASEYNYEAFFKQEMAMRRSFSYPPYYFILLITISHENEWKVHEVAHHLQNELSLRLRGQSTILGPNPSPIPRIKNRYRYQLIVKYRKEPQLHDNLMDILHLYKDDLQKDLQIIVDFNPQHMM